MTKLNYVNPLPHMIMDRVALRNLTHRTAKELVASLPKSYIEPQFKNRGAIQKLNRIRQAISVVDIVLNHKWDTEAAKAFKLGVQRPYS